MLNNNCEEAIPFFKVNTILCISHTMVIVFSLLLLSMVGCTQNLKRKQKAEIVNQMSQIRDFPFSAKLDSSSTPEGMVWIPSGEFLQGAVTTDSLAMSHEKPSHMVAVNGFFMDVHEVTNLKFSKFIDDTGYVTIAERKVDWEELKKQLPKSTPKPDKMLLQPGSLVFKKTAVPISNFYDYSQWWNWTLDANWRCPNGPGSTIKGLDDYPVVHVAYEDAIAYCKWAGRRLPTEAEWEYAARGKKNGTIYYWGNEALELNKYGNTWEGNFPVSNSLGDGFEMRAPVGSFEPNGYGLYDMSGNVWEWTNDWYNTEYYKELCIKGEIANNPKGATRAYNHSNPLAKERVIKGGSFLCSAIYCSSYRISSRMGATEDSSFEHLGFRTVLSLDMLKK